MWQTLEVFGFSQSCIAMIQVLYRDIESLLNINEGLSAPFKVQMGIRQGCSLSGISLMWLFLSRIKMTLILLSNV